MLPREIARIVPVAESRLEPDAAPDSLCSLAQIERRHVEHVLRATAWNKARAARVLEVDIKTLNKKIRDFGITRPA